MTADDFPADPFTGPEVPFIDRLAGAVADMEFESHGAVSTGVRAMVLELLGDREALAEEIQAKIMSELPGSDSNETWKGILTTFDHLFGPEAS